MLLRVEGSTCISLRHKSCVYRHETLRGTHRRLVALLDPRGSVYLVLMEGKAHLQSAALYTCPPSASASCW